MRPSVGAELRSASFLDNRQPDLMDHPGPAVRMPAAQKLRLALSEAYFISQFQR
jgi:hypothetical protein